MLPVGTGILIPEPQNKQIGIIHKTTLQCEKIVKWKKWKQQEDNCERSGIMWSILRFYLYF